MDGLLHSMIVMCIRDSFLMMGVFFILQVRILSVGCILRRILLSHKIGDFTRLPHYRCEKYIDCRPCGERLDDGQLRMQPYPTIIDFWHTHQLPPVCTLLALDQRHRWKLMPENPGKTALVRKKLKQSSISVHILVWEEFLAIYLTQIERAWISEPAFGVYDSVPMEENSSQEHPINVSTVSTPPRVRCGLC